MNKVQKKKAQESLERWRLRHTNINTLRAAYQKKIPDWVVKSMEFEREPVSMSRLKELLDQEKAVPAR